MAMSDRMKSIADMTASMSTRSPERTIDQPTDDVRTSRLMNLIRGMNPTDKPDMRKMSMSTRSPDKIIKDKSKPNLDVLTVISEKMKGVPSDFDPVQVAGEYEDMLMKGYEAAVEQGYKGTFFEFLIDQMDEDFDPASPMRVSRLAEEMKGVPSAMDMKMLRKMITG